MAIAIDVKWNLSRRFGIEYEFRDHPNGRDGLAQAVRTVRGQSAEIAGYRHSHDNDYWDCKTDSSCGLEVSTPVLSGPRGLKVAGDVLQAIRRAGYRVDHHCGQHVHVEVADYDFNQLKVLLCYWLKIEHAVMCATPAHRRGNTYCAEFRSKAGFQPNRQYSPDDVYRRIVSNRHDIVNFSNFARYRTVEFRFGDMTYDVDVVKNRVRFLVRFVELCRNMPAPRDLNWFTPKQVLRFFGLLDAPGGTVEKRFSPAVLSMRAWLLDNLQANMPSGPEFVKDRTQVSALLEGGSRPATDSEE